MAELNKKKPTLWFPSKAQTASRYPEEPNSKSLKARAVRCVKIFSSLQSRIVAAQGTITERKEKLRHLWQVRQGPATPQELLVCLILKRWVITFLFSKVLKHTFNGNISGGQCTSRQFAWRWVSGLSTLLNHGHRARDNSHFTYRAANSFSDLCNGVLRAQNTIKLKKNNNKALSAAVSYLCMMEFL